MSKRIKVCVLGGSALATPKIFDVLGKLGAGASYEFVLYGRDEERLRLVKAVSEQIIAGYPGLDVRVSTSTGLEKSLEGADYCINQVRAGGLEGRAFRRILPAPIFYPRRGDGWSWRLYQLDAQHPPGTGDLSPDRAGRPPGADAQLDQPQ